MRRHIVCLTFDFDAMSGFISRGMTAPTSISRGEFGVVGVARILELLARRGIDASWFIPGVVIETYPEVCARIVEAGHEIGHHGWTHVPPAALSRDEEHAGLVRGNRAIESLCGRKATGYRSPSWDLSPHTVELLLAEGFTYDSSMMGDDYTPYHARSGDVVETDEPMRFGDQTALVEMPVAWSLDDHPYFEFVRYRNAVQPGLRAASDVLENWVEDYRYMARELDWGVITYTFHPYVTGRGHRMLVLERLIEALTEQGAAFTTMERAVAEFEERAASQ